MNNECYLYEVKDELVLLSMLFIDQQDTVIRNAHFVDEKTILLSTEAGTIYKFEYKESNQP